jgi:hypothetical protein
MPGWNPPTVMGALAKRRANKIYQEGGWGRQLTFDAQRTDGTRLFIQWRLPKTVEFEQRAGDAVASGDLVGGDELLASLAVRFEDARVPTPEDFSDPDGAWVHQELTTPTDRAIQVMRISNEPKLEMIYAFKSQFGALTFTFTTANEQMFGPQAREIYRKIAETAWIGTKKRPY